MNSAIKCMFLLACINLCASHTIFGCRCVRTTTFVKVALIADITAYPVRPYCNRPEVIVKMKDGGLRCLDPGHKFTQAALQAKQRLIARKMRTSRSATTTGQSHISNSHNTTTNNFTKPVLKSWWITSNEVLIHLRMNLFSQKGWICPWLGCCLFHPIKKKTGSAILREVNCAETIWLKWNWWIWRQHTNSIKCLTLLRLGDFACVRKRETLKTTSMSRQNVSLLCARLSTFLFPLLNTKLFRCFLISSSTVKCLQFDYFNS